MTSPTPTSTRRSRASSWSEAGRGGDRFHSFDITDDPDPEIDRKIADIHRRRFAAHPDILALVRRIDYQGSGVPTRE